jgi:hypothetical protein
VANLLAHCLSAMAFQSAINPFLGLSFVSESSFLAGMIGMGISLDRDCHNAGRTPYLHSFLFGSLYSLLGFTLPLLFLELEILQTYQVAVVLTVIPSGFISHLLVDALTDEGVFLVPDTPKVLRWFQRRLDPSNSWVHWKKFSLCKDRSNDDPMLNLSVSAASLLVLVTLLALTPL